MDTVLFENLIYTMHLSVQQIKYSTIQACQEYWYNEQKYLQKK